MRLLFLGLLFSANAYAGDVYVNGYTRKDGSYVPPHYRTSPNETKADNWSTKGNTNPYTGKEGSKDPYDSSYSKKDYFNSDD